jgi:hypothetical protein
MRKRLLTAGALAVIALAGCLIGLATGRRAEARAAVDPAWKDLEYQDSSACARCHTIPSKQGGSLDFVLLTEYAIWRTHDKHAQAYAVLQGERGKQMGKILGVDVTKPEAGCLNCHAMYNQWIESNFKGKALSDLTPAQRTELEAHLKDGVGCGGCHGPSSKWTGQHFLPNWRKKTPQEKYADGMVDLRDPTVRARLCMSCHIGSAAEGKVVSHAMFAAGHPPLPPIEIATFSKNMPQHWRDTKDVPAFKNPELRKKYGIDLKNYHAENLAFQQTQSSLIGSVQALCETMKLSRDRAGNSVPRWAWPELNPSASELRQAPDAAFQKRVSNSWTELAMTQSDCYACHHDLRYPSFRVKRGFGYRLPGKAMLRLRAGRPPLPSWFLPEEEASCTFTDSAKELDNLQARLKVLADVTGARPFGRPAEVARAAEGLIEWCQGMRPELEKNALYNEAAALKLLHKLVGMYALPAGEEAKPGAAIPDYETARQLASTIQVVFGEWAAKSAPGDEALAKTVRADLDALTEQLDLEPYVHRRDRLAVLTEVIRKAANVPAGNKPFEQGAKQFSEYLKPENIARMDKLEELITSRNAFLDLLGRGVDSSAFSAELAKTRIANQLQGYSDKEARILLGKMANFDPSVFQATLYRIQQALPPARGR